MTRVETPYLPLTGLPEERTLHRANAHLTFKGNRGIARHGWVRLTPAYGVRLVNAELSAHPDARTILDPFCGTGTTALCAATDARRAHTIDLNPFLAWLATTKTRLYSDDDAIRALDLLEGVIETAHQEWQRDDLWQPPVANIHRWWSPSALAALKALRPGLDKYMDGGCSLDLLLVAFCQSVISTSTAAFNHQSMSFKNVDHGTTKPSLTEVIAILSDFAANARGVIEECEPNPPGEVAVHLGEARDVGGSISEPIDLLVTSPPYCNRMSYIRELRPYMYWLRYLDKASEAGELDWQAIGGTWGVATSRLLTHHDPAGAVPLGEDFVRIIGDIATTADQKNAQLLSNYVHKYFADTWLHIQSVAPVMTPGAEVVYIVGNSTFFGHLVPTEKWYADLLSAAGFTNVRVETIRKRNSNKRLYEYAVRASRP